MFTSSTFLFAEFFFIRKQKRQLVYTPPCSPAYIYAYVLRTLYGIHVSYRYGISRFLQGSPGVSSRRLSSHPKTPHYTHDTYTSTPCKRWGNTSLAKHIPNKSYTCTFTDALSQAMQKTHDCEHLNLLEKNVN